MHSLPPSDRPSDDIIEDDEALDRWYKAYVRRMASQAGGKGDSRYSLLGDAGQGDNIKEFGG